MADFCYILLRCRGNASVQLWPRLLQFTFNSLIMGFEEYVVQLLGNALPPILEEVLKNYRPNVTIALKKEYYSIAETSFIYGPSDKTLYRWKDEGILPFYKIEGKTMIKREDIESLFKEMTVCGINLDKYNKSRKAS